jgi:hypothetical protein
LLEKLGMGMAYDEATAPVELKRLDVKIKSILDQITDVETRLTDLEEDEGDYLGEAKDVLNVVFTEIDEYEETRLKQIYESVQKYHYILKGLRDEFFVIERELETVTDKFDSDADMLEFGLKLQEFSE